MVDSVVTWAKQYKVDGFRFDLMGHHTKANMLKLRAALDALTLANDGVDGKKIYLYGEGWNFGEVANNARFVKATQRQHGRHRHRHLQRPAPRRGARRRPVRRRPRSRASSPACYTDPNGTDQGTADEQHGRLLLETRTGSRSAWPATCATTSSSTATGDR